MPDCRRLICRIRFVDKFANQSYQPIILWQLSLGRADWNIETRKRNKNRFDLETTTNDIYSNWQTRKIKYKNKTTFHRTIQHNALRRRLPTLLDIFRFFPTETASVVAFLFGVDARHSSTSSTLTTLMATGIFDFGLAAAGGGWFGALRSFNWFCKFSFSILTPSIVVFASTHTDFRPAITFAITEIVSRSMRSSDSAFSNFLL